MEADQREPALEVARHVTRVRDAQALPRLKLQTGSVVCFVSPNAQLLQLADARKDGVRPLRARSLLQEAVGGRKLQHYPVDSLFVVEQQARVLPALHNAVVQCLAHKGCTFSGTRWRAYLRT